MASRSTTAAAAAREISRDELRKHASPDSMWIAIDGDVYDVTNCGCIRNPFSPRGPTAHMRA